MLKALGDNTRYAIYLELARSPLPLTTAEVAEVLGLHVNTVRPHLERMREVGLLQVASEPRGSVGRPQHRYSLAADAPALGLEPSPFPTLARVRAGSASVATGLLTVTRADVRLLDRIVERGHQAIHPGRRAMSRRRSEQVVADAHERCLQVNVWTVNAPVTIRRLAAAGVDGLITDVPDVAREVLGIG